METIPPIDMNLTDDPEGGCIVQADDPQLLAATAFDGAGSSGNNSWYWTSMLKLMEQGTYNAPISSCMSTTTSTHNINNNLYTPGAPSTPGQQQATEDRTPPPSSSSPSSSSVHDQPLDMVTQNNALNNIVSDPDSSVWAQEFLSGPIGENKTSSIACSDDGLHELLYPRTVLELLFSDQLKLEQMPSWPDILQAHSTAAVGGPGKSFGFPLASDRSEPGMSVALHGGDVSLDNPQAHMKFTQYLHNYSGIDDRLSSSTASSTLSDNAIGEWGAPPQVIRSSGSQCIDDMRVLAPGTMAHSSPLSSNILQHIDHIHVKQEYSHEPSPTFDSNDHSCNYQSQYNLQHHPHNQRINIASNIISAAGHGFEESMINNEYEQKPANLLSKLWNPGVLNASDPLAHINHKHHIYESITAANFSHHLRQLAGLSSVNNYNIQSVNTNTNHAVGINPGPASSSALQSVYLNQPSQPAIQLTKKSRTFHDQGGASAAARTIRGGAHDPQLESALMGARKDESNNTNSLMLQHAMMMEEDSKPAAATINMQVAAMQQQPSGTTAPEYNSNNSLSKRCRIEQQHVAAAPASTISTSAASTSASTSTSSFKNQPVRKEKLSERIATLQQLVSPFGKTDTASVLLEAIGYIKFLQEQVQTLSSPYFKSPTGQNGDVCQSGEESKPDLRSRGLCLVPLSCTLQVANDNGADYWYGGSFR